MVGVGHPLAVHGRVEGDGADSDGQGARGQTAGLVGQGADEVVDGRLGHAVADHARRSGRGEGGLRSAEGDQATYAQREGI